MNKIAEEFVRDILKRHPEADSFPAIYDAMARAACTRSFYNLGYEELALAGISFSLLETSHLEHLIVQVQELMGSEYQQIHH